MADKRTVRLGDTDVEIVEPVPISPVLVEAIVELQTHFGVMHLSLASLTNDGDGGPQARVCARLRIPLPMLMLLQKVINDAVAEQMPGKEKAN